MLKRFKFFFLSLLLISYALLYIATSKPFPCDADCEAMTALDTLVKKNRDYVYTANRCYQPASDSICVWVKDSSGIDWNLLADTVCQVATSKGLLQQYIIVLKVNSTGNPDTVLKKRCP
jgi:predicted 3-demethylubiquinone-9 3-methyltransferase (glyoxalase superfamily)